MNFSITYIYHDCFVIETERVILIFDFWKDPLAGKENKEFPPLLDELNPKKDIFVLISHHHKDHFTRRVFNWIDRFPSIRYIISEDVSRHINFLLRENGHYKGRKPSPHRVTVLSPGDEFTEGNLRIRAFPSTDIGNSYAVEAEGLRIFHAGDLNDWLVPGDGKEETDQTHQEFISILEKIKVHYPSFDIAMFPVDSRIGENYWKGARAFLELIDTKLFIPMHFEFAMDEKEQRLKDAAAFNLYALKDKGNYLFLCGTRSRYASLI